MRTPIIVVSGLLAALLLLTTACETASASKNAEFVKTVNFSSLDTFEFKHTLISGMSFRESERMVLERLSESVLIDSLGARGFEAVDVDGDFVVVVKWRKAVSTFVNAFDPIDGPSATLMRGTGNRSFARVSLIVELYESASGNLFWRKEMNNAFDAIQFTEDRIVRSLQRAIENFPERIEKDPNLPSLQ